ncbi:hypothetical protein SG34_030980 [Thalassomonas viridans]|uniref:Aspartate/glutamate/uridylate kinase domain-containing protein n=1 Tax=Thalassomonas viridans TaxID=137584 RepID=A0AAE9Z9E4_9GAMM|nr:hypothetical protein [Thalassomonas viridans]WDE09191.1 hypothetical protein SG34_030980 [Thalassomonas viridans]
MLPPAASGLSVHKFGGSSLQCGYSFLRVANIINEHANTGDWIVVSAAGKTTDKLLGIAEKYIKSPQDAANALNELQTYQQSLAAVLPEPYLKRFHQILTKDISLLASLITAAEPRPLDQWLCYGELWSAHLLTLFLESLEKQAIFIDAREILLLTKKQISYKLSPQQLAQKTPLFKSSFKISTGFIASDKHGNTVTLGRNGSDYSASLFGKMLNARRIIFWTDVSGIYSADPRLVANACKLSQLSWRTAELLAESGSSVLHPNTLVPLADSNCEIIVKNSRLSKEAGTIIARGKVNKENIVSRSKNYGLITNSQHMAIDESHIAFDFIVSGSKTVLIRNEYINCYDTNRYDIELVDILLICGSAEQLPLFLKEQELDVLHLHSNPDFCLLITATPVSDQQYALLHEMVCMAQEDSIYQSKEETGDFSHAALSVS